MNIELSLVIALPASLLLGWMLVMQRRDSNRELARLRGKEVDFIKDISQQIKEAAASLGEKAKGKKGTVAYHAGKRSEPQLSLMERAGMESAEARGKFILFRVVCGVGCPFGGVLTYALWIPYYATLFTLVMSFVGIGLPLFWLKHRASLRSETIQRDLPLVLDLANLGMSAGWDVASSLEHVIDAVHDEFPDHPLFKEFKRAKWITSTGFTWEEALARVSSKLNEDTVRRTTMALAQAIKQGGDRSAQLQGIAGDAQRSYYGILDKRLAALPVKAILITMVLLLAYFIVLLAPALVQFKNSMH